MSSREYVSFRSRELGFEPHEVVSKNRRQSLVRARRTIAAELQDDPWTMSYREIGVALGGRDHSTIVSLLKGGKRKTR